MPIGVLSSYHRNPCGAADFRVQRYEEKTRYVEKNGENRRKTEKNWKN